MLNKKIFRQKFGYFKETPYICSVKIINNGKQKDTVIRS